MYSGGKNIAWRLSIQYRQQFKEKFPIGFFDVALPAS